MFSPSRNPTGKKMPRRWDRRESVRGLRKIGSKMEAKVPGNQASSSWQPGEKSDRLSWLGHESISLVLQVWQA